MSIIFQKLKSLTSKSSSTDTTKRENRRQQPQHVYSFRRLIFSPKGIMLIFFTIAGFCMISYFGLSFLKNHLDASSNRAIIIQQSQQNGNPNDMTDMDPSDIDPETGLPYDPDAYAQNTPDTRTARPVIEFKVPEFFLDRTKSQATADVNTDNDQNVPERPGKRIVFEHLPPIAVVPGVHTPEKDTQKNKPLSGIDTPEKTAQKQAVQKDRQHVIQNKKNSEISRMISLSSELEDAVFQKDTARADRILEELFKEKTPSQPYILKLMAYKQIQNENYDQAKQYLQTILSKDKTDFEAGINMAIIEIRQQEISRAKKRLIDLREHHPSREIIENLLDQL